VIAFLILCLIFYEKGLKSREILYRQLYEQQLFLKWEKHQALNMQKHLESQINSQSDFASIQLTLMKKLGVAPEGYQKVYFSTD
jgi:hypothetical protein